MIIRYKEITGPATANTTPEAALAITPVGSDCRIEVIQRTLSTAEIAGGGATGTVKHGTGIFIAGFQGVKIKRAVMLRANKSDGSLFPETNTQKTLFVNNATGVAQLTFSDSASTLDAGSTLTFLVVLGI